MAKANATRCDIEFTLTLSLDEAQYVRAALMYTNPTNGDADYAFIALDNALEAEGYETPDDKSAFAEPYDF